MASNPIVVNPQMQKLADSAVVAARDKFGVSLDFSENSLQQLETLLQQAHEGYKKASSGGNPASISIENTVRLWGSYLGEVIRRKWGGDWVVVENNVFLQVGNRELDPITQVRSQIISGPKYSILGYYDDLSLGKKNDPSSNPKGISYYQDVNIGLHCPKCGSTNILQRTRTKMGWGFGILGFFVGAIGSQIIGAIFLDNEPAFLANNVNGSQYCEALVVGIVVGLIALALSRHTITYYECISCHHEL
jgi:hypothetical protein